VLAGGGSGQGADLVAALLDVSFGSEAVIGHQRHIVGFGPEADVRLAKKSRSRRPLAKRVLFFRDRVFVAGDIAQIVLDWSIDGTDPDGKHVHLGGSASDIVRRGADGFWRYLIDNNLGTAVRHK
jgi:hypothetical protein